MKYNILSFVNSIFVQHQIICISKKFVALFLLFAMVFFAQIAISQELKEDESNGIILQAKKDAQDDVSEIGWCFLGTVGCIFGVAASQSFTPNPEPSRFLGKSPEYIEIYTKAYKNEAKYTQLKYANGGCIIHLAVISALLFKLQALRSL